MSKIIELKKLPDLSCIWFENGRISRNTGPAIIYKDDLEEWYSNDLEEWYSNGRRMSREMIKKISLIIKKREKNFYGD